MTLTPDGKAGPASEAADPRDAPQQVAGDGLEPAGKFTHSQDRVLPRRRRRRRQKRRRR